MEEIKIKDEPVDPEYEKILATIKPEPEDIPDDYFDNIDKDLDDLINNASEHVEDKKPTVPPPEEVAKTAMMENSTDTSNDEFHPNEIEKMRHILKKYDKNEHMKKKRKRRDSSNDRGSPRRKRGRNPSRHSRESSHSRKRSRSRSDDRRSRRKREDSFEQEDIQPPQVNKIKEENVANAEKPPEENIEETEETRRARVVKMCIAVIKTFQKPGKRLIKSRFFYTPSMVPLSGIDHVLEYRSPLNHITNVQFKFNSPSAHVDVQQFGLKTFTDPVTNVSKEIGFDVPQLLDKLSINEIPNALKPEQSVKTVSKDGKLYMPFFIDKASQTEEMSCTACIKQKLKIFVDKAVNAHPLIQFKSVQTESDQELPLMNTINLLNSSQLLAMNDFSEIIRAPAPTNSSELYRLREKLVEIFNLSQRACMMPTKVAPTVAPSQLPAQRVRQVQAHNPSNFNLVPPQTQNQYNMTNRPIVPPVHQHYGGVRPQSPIGQFFNRGTTTPQIHAFPTENAHMNMNMQYPAQHQNGQVHQQPQYPQHIMQSNPQYQTPQPVPAPKVRREDPRSRAAEINISSAPPAPRNTSSKWVYGSSRR